MIYRGGWRECGECEIMGNVEMRKCGDVGVWECGDVGMWGCGNVGMPH